MVVCDLILVASNRLWFCRKAERLFSSSAPSWKVLHRIELVQEGRDSVYIHFGAVSRWIIRFLLCRKEGRKWAGFSSSIRGTGRWWYRKETVLFDLLCEDLLLWHMVAQGKLLLLAFSVAPH